MFIAIQINKIFRELNAIEIDELVPSVSRHKCNLLEERGVNGFPLSYALKKMKIVDDSVR